tara:strand:+ start:305 stop:619 length:315 start_codon:yes stop_codon:yes gene_type:complete
MVYQKNWTAEEDIIMDVLIQTYGKKWSVIKKYFPHRSIAMVKNRYLRRNSKKEGVNKCGTCGKIRLGHTCYLQQLQCIPIDQNIKIRNSQDKMSDAALLLSVQK